MNLYYRLAKLFGVKTTYLVSYVSSVSGGFLYGDMHVTVKPWITPDNWGQVREVVSKESNIDPAKLSIVCCSKF